MTADPVRRRWCGRRTAVHTARIGPRPPRRPGDRPRLAAAAGALAYLLVQDGTPATTGQLPGALWGAEPSAAAVTVVRSDMSRLRRALGAAAVVSVAGGYSAGPATADVTEFERLLGASRSARLSGDDATTAAAAGAQGVAGDRDLAGAVDAPHREQRDPDRDAPGDAVVGRLHDRHDHCQRRQDAPAELPRPAGDDAVPVHDLGRRHARTLAVSRTPPGAPPPTVRTSAPAGR